MNTPRRWHAAWATMAHNGCGYPRTECLGRTRRRRERDHQQPVPGRSRLRAAGGPRRQRQRQGRRLRRRLPTTGWLLGQAGRAARPGTRRSPRCSTGPTRRSRSGSSAASSTSPTTASTGTSRPATATGRLPLRRRARRHPRPSRTPSCKDEVCQAANALIELGVADRRPCRDLPADDPRGRRLDARLRADRRPAHGGVRRLLRRRAAPAASTTARPRSSSPPTAATAAARRRPSSRPSTRPSPKCARRRRSRTCSSSGAPGQDVEWNEGRRRVVARRRRLGIHGPRAASRSTPSTRSTSCTRRAPPASPRASCTPPAATWCSRAYTHWAVFDLKPTTTSTGAPPTSAGSPATPTSSTGRWPTARPRCSTKAPPTHRTRVAGGRSSSKYKVTIFYTAPTAIRTFMKWGERHPGQVRPVVAAHPRLGR